jgi:hypothetical protein
MVPHKWNTTTSTVSTLHAFTFMCVLHFIPGAEGGGLGVYAKSDGGAVYFAATNVSARFNSVTGGSGGEVLPVGMMHPLAA